MRRLSNTLFVSAVAVSFLMPLALAKGIVPEPNASVTPYATKADPETLVLDASDVGRGIIKSTMDIPVRPGPFTFVYPKWIPGYHGPTGPLAAISQLRVSAKGHELAWHRDHVDMYAFHVDVPKGITQLHVRFTALINSPGTLATANVAVIEWNRALFYQNDVNSHDYYFKASIILPKGWGYGTAMPDPEQHGDRIDFGEVPLNMLVDSPLDTGRYFKKIQLWRKGSAYQELDIFADRPQDLDISPSVINEYKNMTPEALALYGARHWYTYHSLLVLSKKIGFEGIEHHQSSDDRAPNDFMTNPKWQLVAGDLLTHEFSHSWNGKYRRPWDLTTQNFQIPQRTDLLWVYEGMNQYLGDLLSFRCGIRKPGEYPQYVATLYSRMLTEPGRATEPLIDTTTAAPYLYQARGEYPEIRRTAGDFYTEGELLWLDVDTIIREKTHGRKSLDSFLHLYAGQPDTGPIVKTYTRADIEKLLNEVVPYHWHAFFQKHVYEVADKPPTSEFKRAGWKFVYSSTPNKFVTASEKLRHNDNQWVTYGLIIGKDGKIDRVREGSPAWDAGIAPGGTLRAVDAQSYSPKTLAYEMKQAENSKVATVFLVERDHEYRSFDVDYHGGPKYPHLVRISGTPNMLAKIMAPHAK